MDYSAVADSAAGAIGVGSAGIYRLYSVSFAAAVPAILCAMCCLDTWNWAAMLSGTSASVVAAWLRFAAVWRNSYALALASSAGVGLGIGTVFASFVSLPSQWFSAGKEQVFATAVTVQANFFGWALGSIIIPKFAPSPHSLCAFLF